MSSCAKFLVDSLERFFPVPPMGERLRGLWEEAFQAFRPSCDQPESTPRPDPAIAGAEDGGPASSTSQLSAEHLCRPGFLALVCAPLLVVLPERLGGDVGVLGEHAAVRQEPSY